MGQSEKSHESHRFRKVKCYCFFARHQLLTDRPLDMPSTDDYQIIGISLAITLTCTCSFNLEGLLEEIGHEMHGGDLKKPLRVEVRTVNL